MDYAKIAVKYRDYSVNFRHDFHKHPEIGFKEFRSSKIIAEELTRLGYSVQSGVAGTGVIATMGIGQPVTLLRFDMDALPVTEETGIDFCSENPGLMHACGHDGHMAIGLTVARILRESQEDWKGTVKFVFQPAEEGLGGCEEMIKAGILSNPVPDYALGVHVWNEKPLGWVGVKSGPVMAGADIFSIKVIGAGGHGAIPQQVKDPIIAAANIITAAQTIVSRNISPLQSGVISFTQVQSGETFNVIPPNAVLKGTIRYFDADVREIIHAKLQQIAREICLGLGCEAEVEIKKLTPALVNEAGLSQKIVGIIEENLPALQVDRGYQTMGSEDMAYIQEKIPGCYLFIGSANAQKGLTFGHHSPKFNFDEDALVNAVAILTSTICNINHR